MNPIVALLATTRAQRTCAFTQRNRTAMKIELIRLFMSDSFSGTRCEAYTSASKIEQEAIREGQEA